MVASGMPGAGAAFGLPCVDRAERPGWGSAKVELSSALQIELLPRRQAPIFESIKGVKLLEPVHDLITSSEQRISQRNPDKPIEARINQSPIGSIVGGP